MENKPIPVKLPGGAAQTMLITLFCRAYDSRQPEPVLKDKMAYNIMQRLDFDFKKFKRTTLKHDMVFTMLRARRFDLYVKAFMEKHPECLIVSIGSGLDTRFFRTDNGKALFYELDLPEVINLRSRLIPAQARNPYISASVLDYSWMEQLAAIRKLKNLPVLIIAEGVFMYIPLEQVKFLFFRLAEFFPGTEVVCDVCSTFMAHRMKRHAGLKKTAAVLQWGVGESAELEQWKKGFCCLDDWHFFDDPETKTGIFRLMRLVGVFNKMIWVVHYRLC